MGQLGWLDLLLPDHLADVVQLPAADRVDVDVQDVGDRRVVEPGPAQLMRPAWAMSMGHGGPARFARSRLSPARAPGTTALQAVEIRQPQRPAASKLAMKAIKTEAAGSDQATWSPNRTSAIASSGTRVSRK